MITSIKNPKRILITSPHNLGDFVAKIPFIRLLKQQSPATEIILLVREYIFPLVACIQEVDRVLDFECFFSRDEEVIIQDLKEMRVDTCIHILSINHSLGPDVIQLAKKANIPNRIGNVRKSHWVLFRKKNFGITHNLRSKRILPDLHEFEWNLLPLKFFGIKVDFEKVNFPRFLKTTLLSGEKNKYLKDEKFNLIVHAGSHGNAKEWPQKHFNKLLEELGGRFHIILTGSLEEKYRIPLHVANEKITDLRGSLSLRELISLISEADGLLAASTGPIHIASLFATHTLALFPKQKIMGPEVWAPKGENSDFIQSQLVCSSCQKKLTDFNRKLCQCMEGITVESVKKHIENWAAHENFV
ncbi:MAG: hypothetical protein S4CHLAM7_03590 [Chlamydiae bacterium]|nr:hypothetical protein [Chlamydiota bacterium]